MCSFIVLYHLGEKTTCCHLADFCGTEEAISVGLHPLGGTEARVFRARMNGLPGTYFLSYPHKIEKLEAKPCPLTGFREDTEMSCCRTGHELGGRQHALLRGFRGCRPVRIVKQATYETRLKRRR